MPYPKSNVRFVAKEKLTYLLIAPSGRVYEPHSDWPVREQVLFP